MTRRELGTGACNGNEFPDHEVAQHLRPSFVVENYWHGYTFTGAQNRQPSVQGDWMSEHLALGDRPDTAIAIPERTRFAFHRRWIQARSSPAVP
jgi:hypothetical protein